MKKKLRVEPIIYKTGIALFISQTLHTRFPFFAIIAAVIVLQPTFNLPYFYFFVFCDIQV
jgi:hypothetical protein